VTRPVRHFLSHQNGDRAALVRLETDMRRRGLLSWRDRKDQARGVATDPAVLKAIESETDGFVLYGSGKILRSEYVWKSEWPPAFLRNRAEADADHPFPYPLIPIFVGSTTVSDLKGAAAHFGKPVPTKFNGERLRRGTAGRRAVANYLLDTALARRHAEAPPGPLKMHVTTFPVPATLDADIALDWAPEFESGVDVPWSELLVARDDLAVAIARTGRPLAISVQARLGPAYAVGRAFPRVSRIGITAGDGWRLGTTEDTSLVAADDRRDPTGDPAVAVVEVAFGRTITNAVDRAITDFAIAPGRRLRIGYGPGADHVDAEVAAAATATFMRRLKALRDDGVHEAHVFLLGPAPLALLLGAAVNAGPAVTLYHTVDGSYVRSVRLA